MGTPGDRRRGGLVLRQVRQLTEELQHSERGRPRLLEISGRLQQAQREGGGGGGGLGGGGDAALDPGAARLNVDAVREWLGTHQAGLAKLVEVQHELLEDLAVLQQVNG